MLLASRERQGVARMRALGAASLLVALLGPACLTGQTADPNAPGSSADTSRLGPAIRQIEPDDRLRVRLTGAAADVEGRFAGAEGETLVLAGGLQQISVPYAEIDGLWTRGRSTVQGMWIGALGGLVIGAVYGAAISEATCAESSCTTLGLAAATAGLGAAGGAALGALIGLAIPRWKQRFP